MSSSSSQSGLAPAGVHDSSGAPSPSPSVGPTTQTPPGPHCQLMQAPGGSMALSSAQSRHGLSCGVTSVRPSALQPELSSARVRQERRNTAGASLHSATPLATSAAAPHTQGVEGYLDTDDDVLVLRVPAAEHVEAGLRAIFGLTPSALAALWFVYWLFAPATGLALALFSALSALLVLGIGGAGLLRVVRSRARSERSEVRIDLGERLFYGAGAEPVIFRQPDAVQVELRGLSARLVLRSDEGDRVLLGRTSLLRHATLVGDARRLARLLDVPLEAPSVPGAFVGLELPRVRRMAVYFPLSFVALPALLTALATSDDEEQRFAARQSAGLYVGEGFTLGLIGAFVGLPALALWSRAPVLASIAVLLPLAALWLVRTALRLYASHRALVGERCELWVLGALARPPRRAEARVSLAPAQARAPEVSPDVPQRRPNYATSTVGSFDAPPPRVGSLAPAELVRRSQQAAEAPLEGEDEPPRASAAGGWWR